MPERVTHEDEDRRTEETTEQLGDPDWLREVSPHVGVRPSASYELEWLLYRIKRAQDLSEPLRLGPGVVVPAILAAQIASFWADGHRSFGELAVLAHATRASYLTDPSDLIRDLEIAAMGVSIPMIGLSSERPDEREALERRIQRLASEPTMLRSYRQLLADAWAAIGPLWAAHGLIRVQRTVDEWRVRLAAGEVLTELLAKDHPVYLLKLKPLLEAALNRREVVVSPCFFLARGHVLDLPGVLSIGVPVDDRVEDAYYPERGRAAAAFTSLLADPRRAAIVSMLLDRAATAHELAAELGLSVGTVGTHLRRLRPSGLVERVAGRPIRYRAMPDPLERLLNEVSARIQGGHGRSSRIHATQVAGDASFRAIFEHAPLAMIQLDFSGRCLAANDAAQRIFGYDESELTQLRGAHLVADDSDSEAFDPLSGAEAGYKRQEVQLRRKDGSLFWSSVTLAVVRDDDGRPRFGFALIEDVSERRGGEDVVTGLPNRALFLSRLERLLATPPRDRQALALLLLDLDGFKQINDRFGHDAGDELLAQVAARMRDTLRGSDMVGRLGGDEFGVLPLGATSIDAATRVAEKLREAIQQPFLVAHRQAVSVGASIGVALSPDHGSTSATLLKAADQAMYRAKRDRTGVAVGEIAVSDEHAS